MSQKVSIWGNFNNGEYDDSIISENDDILVVKYYGQNTGRDDKYICNNSYFFEKNRYYKYIGRVINIEKTEIEYNVKKKFTNYKSTPPIKASDNIFKYYNINTYILTIQKEKDEDKLTEFRYKNDARNNIGLSGGDMVSGIVRH
jgi:hypothetical protein